MRESEPNDRRSYGRPHRVAGGHRGAAGCPAVAAEGPRARRRDPSASQGVRHEHYAGHDVSTPRRRDQAISDTSTAREPTDDLRDGVGRETQCARIPQRAQLCHPISKPVRSGEVALPERAIKREVPAYHWHPWTQAPRNLLRAGDPRTSSSWRSTRSPRSAPVSRTRREAVRRTPEPGHARAPGPHASTAAVGPWHRLTEHLPKSPCVTSPTSAICATQTPLQSQVSTARRWPAEHHQRRGWRSRLPTPPNVRDASQTSAFRRASPRGPSAELRRPLADLGGRTAHPLKVDPAHPVTASGDSRTDAHESG